MQVKAPSSRRQTLYSTSGLLSLGTNQRPNKPSGSKSLWGLRVRVWVKLHLFKDPKRPFGQQTFDITMAIWSFLTLSLSIIGYQQQLKGTLCFAEKDDGQMLLISHMQETVLFPCIHAVLRVIWGTILPTLLREDPTF